MGGRPSERIYHDMVERIRSGFFEQSRGLQGLMGNRFAREAYGIDLNRLAVSK
jgi:hypothetical protein